MEILSYVAELIKTRKELGIPGIGTLYRKKLPGRYDTKTQAFIPPSFRLDFNSEVSEHTALVAFISKKKNISEALAKEELEQFSGALNTELERGQPISLGELGSLQKNADGLTFSPADTAALGFEFYGLPKLHDEIPDQSESITNILAEDPVQEAEPAIEEEPVYEEISEVDYQVYQQVAEPNLVIETAENLEQEESEVIKPVATEKEKPVLVRRPDEPVYLTVEREENGSVWTFYNSQPPLADSTNIPENAQKSMPTYAKVLMAFGIIIAVLALIYIFKPELLQRQPNLSTVPVAISPASDTTALTKDSITSKDSLTALNKPIVSEDSSLKDTVQIKPTPVIAPPTAESAALRFEIIAASLANRKEAENFLAQMKKRGFPAKIADLPGKRLKITLGTFTDEASAKKQLESLRVSTKIPDIYILPVKHTNTNHK